MKLLTKDLLNRLPKLGATEALGEQAPVIVKFFSPTSGWTWYATEFDPVSRNFFGLVHGFENEYGEFSLDELESVRGPFGLGIERDLHFAPGKLTVGEVLAKLESGGHV